VRRLILVIMAVGLLTLASVVPTLANGPAALVFEQDVAGNQFVCGGTTYTVNSGTIRTVMHEGASASGNGNFTFTVSSRNVVASDGSSDFAIVGAFRLGGTFNANTGGGQGTQTDKFQIVAQGGGTVDSVNIVSHFSPGGAFLFNFGTCVFE